MLYFDTSALLPYYRLEERSAAVQNLLMERREPVLLSRLVTLEFASALARWVRMGELDEPQAHRIESAFREDVAAGRFVVRPVDASHFERANAWLLARKTSLRTLDALHLACAEGYGSPLVSLDTALVGAARFLAVPVMHLPGKD